MREDHRRHLQGVLSMALGDEPYALPLNHAVAGGTARIVSQAHELIASMRTFMAYYGHDDYRHGNDHLGRTKMIVVDVERMSARRESDEGRTEFW